MPDYPPLLQELYEQWMDAMNRMQQAQADCRAFDQKLRTGMTPDEFLRDPCANARVATVEWVEADARYVLARNKWFEEQDRA